MSLLVYPGSVSAVVTSLCFSVQMVLFASLVKKTKSKLPNKSIWLSYASIISYSLYSFNIFIMSIIAETTPHPLFNGRVLCSYRYTAPTFFLCGKILMLLFYIMRLFSILHGTTFAYEKAPLVLLATFIVIGLTISGICFFVIVISGLSSAHASGVLSNVHSFPECIPALHESPGYVTLMALAIGTSLIVDFIASIIILRLYLKKLILLSLAYDTFEFKSKVHEKKNETFMKLILKTTNLVIVTIITEYLTLVVNGLQIGEFWLGFDHTINVLCIYLSFGGSNDKLYSILCCCVDKICYKYCTFLCFCCCIPKQVDASIKIAIEENSQTTTSQAVSSLESSKTENKSQMVKSLSIESLPQSAEPSTSKEI